MKKLLEYQADRIEAVLAQHRIPARVTGGTVTPRWIRYDVLPALGVRIGAVTGLAEELAAALGVPSVRVARRGAVIAVEVPREDPRPVRLLPLLQGLRHVPPVTALLGIADDGTPLLLRLPSPNVAHVLVAGTTGSGKTALLRTIVLSLAYFNPAQVAGAREGLRLVLIDPKGSAFRDLEGLPHLARPVIADVAEAVEGLKSLVRWMEVRGRQGEREPGCILVIDELADLMVVGGEAVERPLTRLLQRGREAGIHVVAATQKPTAAVIGSLVKANFPVRLVGKVASPEDAKVASGWRGTGAERLMGKGDFIAVAEGRIHRFQAAYIAPEEVPGLVAEIRGDGELERGSVSGRVREGRWAGVLAGRMAGPISHR
ncbi:MAG: DNA translocase FtsK [Anaerolineae bacterium]|nr:DNA translocase FtsK [Anaerolineae bacterium]